MWKAVTSYLPQWKVYFQSFVVFCVPYAISKCVPYFVRHFHSKKEKTVSSDQQRACRQLTDDFSCNVEFLRQEIGHSSDVKFRFFNLGRTGVQSAIVFLDSLTDRQLIEQQIMNALMADFFHGYEAILSKESVSAEYLKNHVLPIIEMKVVDTLQDLVSEVLTGSTAFFIDGSPHVFVLGTRKGIYRSLAEPVSEPMVRGPRIGFNESLADNVTLLRQHGETPSLTITSFQVGERSKKELVIAYLRDVANPDLVEEVKNRINQIKIDDVLDTGYVEQFIEDNYLSLFPQMQNTERPDRVMSALMEGRVAILLEGTPFALIAPVTFSMFLQSPEDYYDRWIPGTLIRYLRYFALIISAFGPSLYIAFVSFHQGLIPTKLAISIAATREGVPFPSMIEALIMEVSIEILREAGLRLPKPIGQTISIVGGLVIGQAAVQAGIVSPIMVIVVAVTAISSFAIPQYSVGIALRILRFAAMLSAAVFGLYGVILFFLLVCSHLVKLKSFGVPYTSPVAPIHFRDWKDVFVRTPLMMMKRRPKTMKTTDSVRIKNPPKERR